MKVRKLKVRTNMDNDWMYCVYQNKGQWSITLGVMSLGSDSWSFILHCHVTMSFSDVSCKHELKMFQHYGYFSYDGYSQIF